MKPHQTISRRSSVRSAGAVALALSAGLLSLAVSPGHSFAQSPASAPAPDGAASNGGTVTLRSDRQVRDLDCRGADVVIEGDDNSLGLTACSIITVPGNRNHIRAQLMTSSAIAVSGSSNVIRWIPAPGSSPQVSDSGRGNTLAPDYSAKDSISHTYQRSPAR